MTREQLLQLLRISYYWLDGIHSESVHPDNTELQPFLNDVKTVLVEEGAFVKDELN